MTTLPQIMLVEDQPAHGRNLDKRTSFNLNNLYFSKLGFILSALRNEDYSQ